MKIHQLTTAEALSSLQSGPDGLGAAEARRRLAEYGPNVLERVRGEPMALRFAKGFTHFFAIILWVAAALAFVAEWRDPGQGMATLGFAILGVIVVNGGFSFWQEYRAERALLALQQLLPRNVQALRGGGVAEIPAADLVPGDVVLIEEGSDVPADCRLIGGSGVRVSNATVTGESQPHSRSADPDENDDLLHSRNVLLAGTSLVSGRAKALVFATGSHTAFGKIARLTQQAREPLSPLQREIARLSRIIAALSVALGAVFFVIGSAIGLSFWANLVFAIGVIVANVPEGLLPTVTLALAMGSQRMARRNALVRHLPAVETLGAATVICTDKTGTLTLNHMAAKRLFLGGKWIDPADAKALGAAAEAHPRFFEIAAHCHSAKIGRRHGKPGWLGDPMEIALVELALAAAPGAPRHPQRGEVPFDSERRRMSTLHDTPEGAVLYHKGAPEVVLARCTSAQRGEQAEPFTPEMRDSLRAAVDAMAAQGLRVLAFAFRRAPAAGDPAEMEHGLTLAGLVGLEDPPRPEVPGAIARCREAGIRVIMVTGDHPHTAQAIAREIGLVRSGTPSVITGEQLARLSDTQLQLALDAPEILFARVQADQKMRIVSALKRKQEIVAVTGDGVNDAPALKQADIGIAMGLCGTDVARETADMVLLDDNFASIVAAIEEGRAVFANMRKFFTYILTHTIPELVPYLAFALCKIPLPLTVIQILAIDLGTDTVTALALGAEKPHPEIMRQPPRPRGKGLIDWRLFLRAYGFLGVVEATASMCAFFFVLKSGGWIYGQSLAAQDPLYLQATTACLSAIVVMQVVNVFLCRSAVQSAFRFGLFSNRLLLLGIATEIALILTIDYTPWGNLVFGTAPIPLAAWLAVLPFAAAMLALEELRKWGVRRRFAASRS